MYHLRHRMRRAIQHVVDCVEVLGPLKNSQEQPVQVACFNLAFFALYLLCHYDESVGVGVGVRRAGPSGRVTATPLLHRCYTAATRPLRGCYTIGSSLMHPVGSRLTRPECAWRWE